MARNRSRYPLSLIREVLDHAAAHGNASAHRTYGLHYSTIRRWQMRALREVNGWPRPEDIAAWDTEATDPATAGRRQRRAAQVARYRARRYVNRGPLWIDATGTVRRLRALMAIGWTQRDLSTYFGTSDQYISLLTRGRHPKVHIDTAAKVAAVYTQLAMTVPAHRPAWVHDRQRRYAANRGWAPPLAWDDIDNPDEDPTGAEYAA